MPIDDLIAIPLLVIVIPIGFVWVTRNNASMHRAKMLLAWSVVVGALAMASLLATRGGGLGAAVPALAFLGLGFISLVLRSWSIQTAIAAALHRPNSRHDRPQGRARGPTNFDPINFRGLLALIVVNAWIWLLLASWLWTGSAKNLLRPIGILGPSSPSILTLASNHRHFLLQVFLLALVAVPALVALILIYRSMARRGQL